MPEIAIITQLKDEPAALFVLGIFVVYKIGETFLAHFLPWLKKKGDHKEEGHKDDQQDDSIKNLVDKLSKIEAFLEKDAIDRKKRQDEVDKRIEKHYEYIKEAALQSGTAVVWTPGVPFLELLKAAVLNIKLGANGNLRTKLVEAIIKEPNGIVTWKSFLSTYVREHGPMSKHFNETIEWVEKRIA